MLESSPEARRISVVVPLYNEASNVTPLVEAVIDALGREFCWELILVDDGSEDDTASRVREWSDRDSRVKFVTLARNYGQSTALQAGFDRVQGDVVVTMDGDLQNDPKDIPRLVERLERGYDLVTGYRKNRKDSYWRRTVPSRAANALIRWMTGVRVRDHGCGLKAFRRELVSRLHLYSDQHRFIPAIAVSVTGARIGEIPVRHHPRLHGDSKYGLTRVWKVLADLLTLKMIRSFRDRPLILFGTGGLGSSVMGGLAGAVAVVATWGPADGTFVFPAASLLWFGLGFFLFTLGLISEVVVRGCETQDPGRRYLDREVGP